MAISNFVAVTAEELRDLLAEALARLVASLSVAGVAVVEAEQRALSRGGNNVRAVGLGGGNGHSVELGHC